MCFGVRNNRHVAHTKQEKLCSATLTMLLANGMFLFFYHLFLHLQHETPTFSSLCCTPCFLRTSVMNFIHTIHHRASATNWIYILSHYPHPSLKVVNLTIFFCEILFALWPSFKGSWWLPREREWSSNEQGIKCETYKISLLSWNLLKIHSSFIALNNKFAFILSNSGDCELMISPQISPSPEF